MPIVSQNVIGTFCRVDLTTPDPEAARNFYGALYGWEFQFQFSEAKVIYSMGLLNGKKAAGIGQSRPSQVGKEVPSVWSSYICVEDAAATAVGANL